MRAVTAMIPSRIALIPCLMQRFARRSSAMARQARGVVGERLPGGVVLAGEPEDVVAVDDAPEEYLEELQAEMLKAAANLEFERAAQLRDEIAKLKGQPTMAPQVKKTRRKKKTQRG